MLSRFFKHHEFWPSRVFELPFYVYLGWQCLRYGISPKNLAKANYALDHGEIGLGSKFDTQRKFDAEQFPVTSYLAANLTKEQRLEQVKGFATEQGYPIILKPDIGITGKGLVKLDSDERLATQLDKLEGGYLLQSFCQMPLEFGVFYCRIDGHSQITGINQKHFPCVTGDGRKTVLQLAHAHPRYTEHWHAFLQYVDTSRVPQADEEVLLSFIGSHTLGCLFTDDSYLLTDELHTAVCEFVGPVSGYNFGRLDLRTDNVAGLQKGEFTVIEVNGISSLPTHMFDPKYTLLQAYNIFFEHARYLVCAAKDNAHQPMALMSLLDVARKVRVSQRRLNRLHSRKE